MILQKADKFKNPMFWFFIVFNTEGSKFKWVI